MSEKTTSGRSGEWMPKQDAPSKPLFVLYYRIPKGGSEEEARKQAQSYVAHLPPSQVILLPDIRDERGNRVVELVCF